MKKISKYIVLLFGLLAVSSCKVYDDPEPIFEEEQSSVVINKRRVLIINVDGAIGEVVRDVMPQNIASLLPTSKYTFSSISDANTNYASTWASIAKGVGVSKHMVENDQFTHNTEDGHLHETIPHYPSFFYRLEEINPYYKTSIIMRDSALARELFNEVENRRFFTSDQALVDYTENYLKTTKDMISMVQLSSVMEIGRVTGFGAQNPAYVEAINQVDQYIGKLVNAVKSRENYADEEWLILIQSNNGGSGNQTGGDNYESKNIFVVLNYPKFQSYEFLPKFINGTRLFKTSRSRTDYDRNGLEATSATPYDMTGNEMTVEFFIKANTTNFSSVSNTFVFGKSSMTSQNVTTNKNGWFVYQRSKATAFYMIFDDGTEFVETTGFPAYSAGKWDHVAVTVTKSDRNVELKIYTNGELTRTSSKTLTNAAAKIVSSAPFKLQHGLEHNSFHSLDIDLAEIRIFNKALSASQIERHACALQIDEQDDAYSNLTGYYPLSANFENKIANQPSLVPMLHNNTLFPNTISASKINTVCDVDVNKGNIITNTDVAPLTFYWLRRPYSNYGWNAYNPLKNFEIEFLGSIE